LENMMSQTSPSRSIAARNWAWVALVWFWVALAVWVATGGGHG